MAPILFYDLVTGPGGSFFSPFTMKARLALLNKGVEFEVRELTYTTIRGEWSGVDGPLGVEHATVPFIRKPDGTYLIDSLKIIEWVDESYPDRPNTYLPEAPLPVDTTSPAYKEVVSKALLFYKTIPTWAPIFYIYAPTIISYLNQQDLAHFTAWEPGEWEKVLEEAKDRKSVMTNAKKWANALEEALGDKDFFASKTAPGYTDFEIMGRYQMGRVDGAAMQEIFAGKLGAWLDRMNTRFAEGLKEVRARDVPF